MTRYVFGSKELCKCLKSLGFVENRGVGSSHIKFSLALRNKTPKGTRPFIIVIMGRKGYDPHTCSSYLKQIRALGFKKEEIILFL